MIAKIERKWVCAAKDHTESGKPDAAWINCSNFKVAPSLNARIRHGSWEGRKEGRKEGTIERVC